jgi:hypothetical protein
MEQHLDIGTRLIKYVLDTENYGLKIKPFKTQEMFTLEGISDSEYAGETDTRISVYGCIIYFCGAPMHGNLNLVKA